MEALMSFLFVKFCANHCIGVLFLSDDNIWSSGNDQTQENRMEIDWSLPDQTDLEATEELLRLSASLATTAEQVLQLLLMDEHSSWLQRLQEEEKSLLAAQLLALQEHALRL
jgi:hypothetical protein